MTNTITGTTGADNLSGDTNSSDLNDLIDALDGFDTLFGLSGNDTLLGGDGNDFIVGGDGNDSVDGGAGFDYVYFDGGPAGVVANLAKGKATGWGRDVFVNAEGLVGGIYDDKLVGDAFDNGLAGLEGNDTLNGAGGEDYAYYNFATLPVTVDLGAGTSSGSQGNDLLISIEHVMTGAGDDVIIGSDGNNSEWGQAGADTLSGLAGADQLSGEDGADSLDGGKGNDNLFGGLDDDVLKGGAHNDYLGGDAGADRLEGGAGLDYLYGAEGADTLNGGFGGGDTLTGGLDGDRFRFLDADIAVAWVDTWIFDFFTAEGDVIDLLNIDANASKAGNQAFKVVAAFTNPGQMVMTYDSGANTTRIECQIDADSAVDFSLVVNGDVTGGAGIVL